MSVAIEEGRKSNPKGKCVKWIWCLFPHVFLILSLMSFAVLGAQIFKEFEEKSPYNESVEFRKMMHKVMQIWQNHNGMASIQKDMLKIKNIWNDFNVKLDQNWTFYRALFFCCTVFTTVGYGNMYPKTPAGKVACILYAMVGIPLMLLVISDVGDILAVLLSKAYARLSLFFKRLVLNRSRSLQEDSKTPLSSQLQSVTTDGTYTLSQDVVVHDTTTVQKVMRPKLSMRRKSLQHRTNKEIFDRIVVTENFKLKRYLTKSFSCPELDHMPPPPKGFRLFTDIGQEMDRFNVPLLVILLVVFAYMLICSQILRFWEDNMCSFDAFYFIFITLTTIGFGDIVPEHPKYFMVTFLFIITGMAVMSMAFKLGQSQIVSCYRRFIKCISMGKVGMHKDLHSN